MIKPRKRGEVSNRNGIHKETGVEKCGEYAGNGSFFGVVFFGGGDEAEWTCGLQTLFTI